MSSSKIPFKTAYGERTDQYITPSGDGTQEVYEYQINKYGQKELVLVGYEDLYSKIQESLEEVKIENILNRVAMGDNTVLRPDGIYEDVSEAPKSLLEARQQMQKLENIWNGLDINIKREYNFNVEEFISQSGTEKWLKDMGLIPKSEVREQPTNEQQTTTEGGAEQ